MSAIVDGDVPVVSADSKSVTNDKIQENIG